MSDLLQRLRSALEGRYDAVREIGRGGMATVFLATDLKHSRDVAIKVLHPDLAAGLGAERFLREIEIAARLQHPHILPVYDSGEAGGLLYYVMPYVDGESLRDRLKREHQLPIEDVLRIGAEVADALAYAHDRGVVHRDIKPENVLLTGGHALVADFGIARAVSAAGGGSLTQTGTALGTPAYMSPEHGAGQDVDARTDQYSLACTIYEMLIGQPPFTGPTPQAVMARHTLETVPSLQVVRSTIPDEVEDAILRALAKVPADRFATVTQFAETLAAAAPLVTGRHTVGRPVVRQVRRRRRHVALAAGAAVVMVSIAAWQFSQAGPTPAAVPSDGLDPRGIAVLYFDDLSRAGELAYLADGVTEELISRLGDVRGLSVVSRHGVAPFRNGEAARDSIARALGVGTLIAGSLEPVDGTRVRVTTRLVDGGSGADFARRSYTLPLEDVGAINEAAADDITGFLRSRLGEEFQLRERRRATASPDAWSFVLRAERLRKEAEAAAHHDPPRALRLLDQADELLARAERADAGWIDPLILRAWVAYEPVRYTTDRHVRRATLERALGHAERAVAAEPGHPQALEIRGTIWYAMWLLDLPPDGVNRSALVRRTRQDLEAAIRADAGLASAHATLSFLHHDQKDVVAALLAARNAYQADAYFRHAEVILDQLFHGSYNLTYFAEARRWCAEGQRRFPQNFAFAECELRMLFTPDARPDVDLAWQLVARIDSLAPAPRRELYRRRAQIFAAAVLARAALPDSADRVLTRARADHLVDPNQFLIAYEAVVRAILGEHDHAIELLKRAVAANPDHAFEAGGDVHWWWRELRGHPEFRQVLARSN